MSAFKRFCVFATAGVATLVLLFGGCVAILHFTFHTMVMKKQSPDGQHVAKLVRLDGIDVIFRVSVDGDRVYSSPDFAPVDADFREQIAWDKSGQIVVLEVAGKRIFGWHAIEKRRLTARDLDRVAFTPFEDLGFEGPLHP